MDLSTRAGQVAHYAAVGARCGRNVGVPIPVARFVPPRPLPKPEPVAQESLRIDGRRKRGLLAISHIAAWHERQIEFVHPVIRAVAKAADISPTRVMAVKGRKGDPHETRARHVAAYLMRKLYGTRMETIAQRIGVTNHTTALHAIVRVAENRDCPAFADLIAKACAAIGVEEPR